jgi:hypothetical protein
MNRSDASHRSTLPVGEKRRADHESVILSAHTAEELEGVERIIGRSGWHDPTPRPRWRGCSSLLSSSGPSQMFCVVPGRSFFIGQESVRDRAVRLTRESITA